MRTYVLGLVVLCRSFRLVLRGRELDNRGREESNGGKTGKCGERRG